MTAPPKTLLQLAEDAEAMPWEDQGQLDARWTFQQAITAEAFLQLVRALRETTAVCEQLAAGRALIQASGPAALGRAALAAVGAPA